MIVPKLMSPSSFLVPRSSFLETLAQLPGLAPKYSRLRLYFGACPQHPPHPDFTLGPDPSNHLRVHRSVASVVVDWAVTSLRTCS